MEDNRNEIIYEENWQSVSEPETPVIVEPSGETEEEPARRRRTPPGQLLLTVQLILCLLAALAAFVLKSVGGEVYQTVRQWYVTALNSSAIFDGRSVFDPSALWEPETADEA